MCFVSSKFRDGSRLTARVGRRGAEFLNALDASDFEAMRRLWTESAEKRGDIAKLITPILELLHHTGERGNDFIAAYLNGYDDQYIPLRVQLNDWAKCLPDSPRMATCRDGGCLPQV
jgi:hypothetical protein